MAIITKALLPLIAPTLTYTVDEVMDYAPKIIKGEAKDAFDLVYEPINLTLVLKMSCFLPAGRNLTRSWTFLRRTKR